MMEKRSHRHFSPPNLNITDNPIAQVAAVGIIVIVGLFASKYLMNGFAGVVRGFKNLKDAIKE